MNKKPPMRINLHALFHPGRQVAVVQEDGLEHVVTETDPRLVSRVRRRDHQFQERLNKTDIGKKRLGLDVPVKRQFFLWRLFRALFTLMGFVHSEPVKPMEVVMAKKKKEEDDKPKPSIFTWEGLVRLLGPIGAGAVVAFCVVAFGITFWNVYAGIAFVIVCGCIPAVIIVGIAGYIAFQKAMNKRDDEEEDDDKDEKKE